MPSAVEARMRRYLESKVGSGPNNVEEFIVFSRVVITDRAPKNRYNSMVITKLEEAELLWNRGRGLA